MAVTTDSATVMVRDFRCNGCGSPLKIPKNSKGHVRCPSCKTECVIEGLVKNAEIAAKENINSGIPLTASPATLHRQIVSLLFNSPNIPMDVFDKTEVIREERYCVPAYCFYCNATASFTYEVGVERKQTYVKDGRTEEKIHKEWTPSSSSASASLTVFASGSREMALLVNEVYMELDPRNLIDIEELDFPADVETYGYDLPQAAAFSEYIVPYVDDVLQKKAKDSLTNQNVRNLSMGGSSIQKETVRVYLGFYRVVFKYGGKEYLALLTSDGGKVVRKILPEDLNRKKAIEEKQKAIEEKQKAIESIEMETSGVMALLFWLTVLGFLTSAIGGYFYNSITSLFGGLIVGGVCGIPCNVLYSRSIAKRDAQKAEAEKKLEAFLEDFKDPWVHVKQRFWEQKKALRGIYEDVTGDESAF